MVTGKQQSIIQTRFLQKKTRMQIVAPTDASASIHGILFLRQLTTADGMVIDFYAFCGINLTSAIWKAIYPTIE